MTKIKDNVNAAKDISQLKTAIAKNIDLIREGVEDFVGRANTRHEATEIRNKNLSTKIKQMEKETEQLQQKLPLKWPRNLSDLGDNLTISP